MRSVAHHQGLDLQRWLAPEIVGPGDETWIYLPQTIQSVKGYWNGVVQQAEYTIDDEPNAGIQAINASTQTTTWPNSISVKSGEKYTNNTLWVRLRLPNDPKLANKKLNVNLKMTVTYPAVHPNNPNSFLPVTNNVTQNLRLQASSAGAGALYGTIWHATMVGGLLALLLAQIVCLVSASNLKSSGLPTQILPR